MTDAKTPAKTAKPTEGTVDDRKKRKRKTIAIGAAAAVGLGLGLLLLSSNASASSKRLKTPPSKAPGKSPEKGGGVDEGKKGGGTKGPSVDPETLPTDPKEDPTGPGDDGFNLVAPGGGGGTGPTPVGPNPGPEDLPEYYNDENPDPGKFYQVTSGGSDAKGLLNIAKRYAITSLFLAARNAGGLSVADAIEWAEANAPRSNAEIGEWADYILCTAWNDVHYGSNRVAAKNRRGPHGRGIDLVPQHADNWRRILDGRNTLRNVRLHAGGDVGTPRNESQGDKKLPLLWMPRLDDEVLWTTNGSVLRAGGPWANGASFFFPPPIVLSRSIDDPTNANLGIWGCGDGVADYG